MSNELFSLLDYELKLLSDASSILIRSYENCKRIGIKEEYSMEELDKFESLTSRFARMSDILLQKVIRLIDEIDLDSQGTIRDRINRAEKKELIESADLFIKIRMLRNDITHEYMPEIIEDIFRKVFSYTPILIDSVERIKKYCMKYFA